jgi:cation transport ATPase
MMTAVGIQTYTLRVKGMHCKACVFLTESELAEHPKVVSAKASLRTRSVEIRGDFGNRPPEDIAEELSAFLSEHSLSTTARKRQVDWDEFGIAVPIAISGLVLSISATFARLGDRTKPQALFHVGRIASFLVLGGARRGHDRVLGIGHA